MYVVTCVAKVGSQQCNYSPGITYIVYMNMYIYIYMCVHEYVYIRTYTCVYMNMYMYIYNVHVCTYNVHRRHPYFMFSMYMYLYDFLELC